MADRAREHPIFLHPAGEMKDTVSTAGLIDRYSSKPSAREEGGTRGRGGPGGGDVRDSVVCAAECR